MTTLIKTETGSLYEIDLEGKRLRRIEGISPCLPRVGEDGVWKIFERAEILSMVEPKANQATQHLVVIWSGDGRAAVGKRATVTSPIVEIREGPKG